jgi:hypothetical protein
VRNFISFLGILTNAFNLKTSKAFHNVASEQYEYLFRHQNRTKANMGNS